MRKWFAPLAAAALVVALSAPAAAAAPVRVEVAGQELVSDVPPFIENQRTMVPLRALASQLGFDVSWEPEEQKVLITKWPKTVELTIGSKTALVNGREVQLDAPARLVNGRTMVPLRFISEGLGAEVSWDQTTSTASVQPPGPQVEQAWELLRKTQENQVAGMKGTGEMSVSWSFRNVPEGVNLPSMPSVSTKMEFQSLREDALVTAETTMNGETTTVQSALYHRQIWVNLPGEGWQQFGNKELSEAISQLGLPSELSLDLDALAQLSQQLLADGQAKVLTRDNLDGVDTYVVSLDLSDSPLLSELLAMSGEAMEGSADGTLDRFVVNYWVDESGFTHKYTVLITMSMPLIAGQEGPVMVNSASGRFLFQPSDEPVPFPAEITGQSDSASVEEERAEQPAEESGVEVETGTGTPVEAPAETPVPEAPAA